MGGQVQEGGDECGRDVEEVGPAGQEEVAELEGREDGQRELPRQVLLVLVLQRDALMQVPQPGQHLSLVLPRVQGQLLHHHTKLEYCLPTFPECKLLYDQSKLDYCLP